MKRCLPGESVETAEWKVLPHVPVAIASVDRPHLRRKSAVNRDTVLICGIPGEDENSRSLTCPTP